MRYGIMLVVLAGSLCGSWCFGQEMLVRIDAVRGEYTAPKRGDLPARVAAQTFELLVRPGEPFRTKITSGTQTVEIRGVLHRAESESGNWSVTVAFRRTTYSDPPRYLPDGTLVHDLLQCSHSDGTLKTGETVMLGGMTASSDSEQKSPRRTKASPTADCIMLTVDHDDDSAESPHRRDERMARARTRALRWNGPTVEQASGHAPESR